MKKRFITMLPALILTLACMWAFPSFAEEEADNTGTDVILSDDASDFVLLSEAVPDAILEIRYYSTYNFVGERIDGYEEPLAFLTKEAAQALREASDELVEKGYRLKIFDAYRPQRAVTHFMNWALDPEDVRMKDYFYPELEKDVLFPQGYIAEHSGHSRGSTVDLTLFDIAAEKEVDMGGTFDYFGELSHPDYTDITKEQYANRMLLREVMLAHGFKPLAEEWWHFTLEDEPFPETYFTFPINSDSLLSGAEEQELAEDRVPKDEQADDAGDVQADNAGDAQADDDGDIQYVMYLGTNDQDTNKPVFTQAEAMEKAKEILIGHFGGYTIQEANGGWVDEGTEYQEYTLVIYLSDTTADAVHAAADELIKTFHQSSVMIQANPTTTEFYTGAN